MSTVELYKKIDNRDGKIYMVTRYLAFISSRRGNYIKGVTHQHHILPKARDFFPLYKDLSANPWNSIHLTPREHFIAHWMLARAFPKSSQARVFFYMINKTGGRRSHDYAAGREAHIETVRIMTQDPERNAKISAALSGRPKSEDHKRKMTGHVVTVDTREKLRQANLGRVHTDASREKMSQARIGKSKKPNSPEAIERMRQTKLAQKKRWCNNGLVEKMLSELPEGWVYGKLISNTKGRKHYNNGVISKLFITPPDDTWVLGRL